VRDLAYLSQSARLAVPATSHLSKLLFLVFWGLISAGNLAAQSITEAIRDAALAGDTLAVEALVSANRFEVKSAVQQLIASSVLSPRR
jgi:hypothetical protein